MARKTTPPTEATQKLLTDLGENIRLARLRRRLSSVVVAERAGMSRSTLYSIERGDSGVTIGSYVNVLLCLGLEEDLSQIASVDLIGRKLQDSALPRKPRKLSSSKSKSRKGDSPWGGLIGFGQDTLIGGLLFSVLKWKKDASV